MRNKDKRLNHVMREEKAFYTNRYTNYPMLDIVYNTQLAKLVQQLHLLLKMLFLVLVYLLNIETFC